MALETEDLFLCAEILDDVQMSQDDLKERLFALTGMNPFYYLIQECEHYWFSRNGHCCFRIPSPSPIRLQIFKECVSYCGGSLTKLVLDEERTTAFIKTTLNRTDLNLEKEINFLMADCPNCSTDFGQYFNCDFCKRGVAPTNILVDYVTGKTEDIL